eukprot:CAMPEP_0179870786 /NCGR_PEP_ID=MMETSP0982-20121206/20455_1 /TAXON_ID=483367 /ORGANISM="non described non described, Strain CCMP 2436" /LENGTH=55 /DNA_ID=CAMNT_0021761367 /DNA_START=312 /DNA_END=476 /DNA_ORIENTATION=-
MADKGVAKYTSLVANRDATAKQTPLHALAANAAGELQVLGHDGHALGVDRAQVRI